MGVPNVDHLLQCRETYFVVSVDGPSMTPRPHGTGTPEELGSASSEIRNIYTRLRSFYHRNLLFIRPRTQAVHITS